MGARGCLLPLPLPLLLLLLLPLPRPLLLTLPLFPVLGPPAFWCPGRRGAPGPSVVPSAGSLGW